MTKQKSKATLTVCSPQLFCIPLPAFIELPAYYAFQGQRVTMSVWHSRATRFLLTCNCQHGGNNGSAFRAMGNCTPVTHYIN